MVTTTAPSTTPRASRTGWAVAAVVVTVAVFAGIVVWSVLTGAIHDAYGTPHHAIGVQALWAAVLVSTGTYRALFTRVVYTEWIFFGLMAAGVFVLGAG